MCNIRFRGRMKVLIAGASGYIGRHVTSLFRESQFEVFVYSRNHMVIPKVGVITSDSSKFNNYFDVVINCARPHWSEYSPNERLCCVIRFRSRVALLRLIVSQYGKF